MGKYKIGDLITIRKDLAYGDIGESWVSYGMLKYRGRKAKITELGLDNDYYLCVDRHTWCWTHEMFEGG